MKKLLFNTFCIVLIMSLLQGCIISGEQADDMEENSGPGPTAWQTLAPGIDPYANFRATASSTVTPEPSNTQTPVSPVTPAPTPSSTPVPSPTLTPAPIETTTPPPVSTPTPSPTPTPTPYDKPLMEFPVNGYIKILSNKEAIAPFSVQTPDEGDYYYIVLKDYTTRDRMLSIFIYPNSLVELTIPLGDYLLFYATGKSWYGEEYLFGPETNYAKSDDMLTFYISGEYVMGMTIELIKQSGGNMSTEDITESDFLN